MQQRYDLWRAERELRQDLERIEKYQEFRVELASMRRRGSNVGT